MNPLPYPPYDVYCTHLFQEMSFELFRKKRDEVRYGYREFDNSAPWHLFLGYSWFYHEELRWLASR